VDVKKCPHCGSSFTAIHADDGRCGSCGHQLPPADNPPPEDTRSALVDDDLETTLDPAAQPNPPSNHTGDWQTEQQMTIDPSRQTGQPAGALIDDADELDVTIDPQAQPCRTEHPPDHPAGAISQDDTDQTLDPQATPDDSFTPFDSPAAAVGDDDDTEMTIDPSQMHLDDGPSTGVPPTSPTRTPDEVGPMSSGAIEQRIRKHWAGAVGDDSTPMTTLKGGLTRLRTATATITAKKRHVTEPGGPPDPIADYHFLEQLGEGGMGVVFTARQTSIDREIAIKMIKAEQARNTDQCSKFVAEAVVTGDLEHPNIVPVYDLGTNDQGQPFYAMKRVRGTPWDQKIGSMSVSDNLDVLLRVADAIAFAHSRGVIHRDLKPSNIMLGEFGEVLVMDWGVAVAVSQQSKAARINDRSAMCGTPAYMAPEMANGDMKKIGVASDVYLLGAMLYQVVTGLRPHGGDKVMACLINAAANTIQPTDQTGELVDIARKAMATEPTDRYPSVKEFQQAIRDYQSHRQSIVLSDAAEAHLAQAGQSRDYDHFTQALVGFRQALEMWSGNHAAGRGVIEAAMGYARCALQKNDLDLARSLLDPQLPEHAPLLREVEAAQREQQARQRRYAAYRMVTRGLAAAIIVILTVASLWINAEKQRAVSAETRAVEQAEIADAASAKARAAEAEAVGALEKMKKAVAAMIEARSKEEQAKARASAAEVMAVEAQDELARSGMLTDSRWWTFDPATAKHKQYEAEQHTGYPSRLSVSLPNDRSMELQLIPAGSFVMGSPAAEADRGGEEYLHRVVITQPFYLSRFELTEAQWQAVTGERPPNLATTTDRKARADDRAGRMVARAAPAESRPDRSPSNELPVMEITWQEVTEKLLPALNAHAPDGFEFVLPTEAQWEYACRAGTATAYHDGDGEKELEQVGWYLANSERSVQPVGTKPANPWGLHDMHGNVAEWCADAYDPRFYLAGDVEDPYSAGASDQRVIRGGGCINLPEHCRSAYRSWANASNRYRFLGVRVALVRAEPTLQADVPIDTDQTAP
jgi:formylglycine-generating enzyme required for sulfatase activity